MSHIWPTLAHFKDNREIKRRFEDIVQLRLLISITRELSGPANNAISHGLYIEIRLLEL